MALPAIIVGAASRAGLGTLAKTALSKVGSFLFGTKLRTGLTALSAGMMLNSGGSRASNSQAAQQSVQHRG